MSAIIDATPAEGANHLLQQMTARQNIAPKRLVAPGPTEAQLQLIFNAAAQAPDHGRIQPWRLILVPAQQRARLGAAFVEALRLRDPDATQEQINAAHEKALRAPCLMLAIVSNRPSDPPIPLPERLIALGCAIQNMLLMAEVLGIGSGITSGHAMNAPSMRDLFALAKDEEGICFLNFGTVSARKPPRARSLPGMFVSSLGAST